MVDIVPAILSYSRHDLLDKISRVRHVAHAIHIDVMDGLFVHNKTVGPSDLKDLPFEKVIEYHLMVADPAEYMHALPGGPNVIYQVHFEASRGKISELEAIAAQKHSKLCVAVNPATDLEEVASETHNLNHVLFMTVVPGIDGQRYMPSVETKISQLRALRPGMTIEVDGGINISTARRAAEAGASRLAAATAIFGSHDAAAAYRQMYLLANGH